MIRSRIGIVALLWLAIGFLVAGRHDYFDDLETWRRLLSAALAIVLWPLLVLGIDLHITR